MRFARQLLRQFTALLNFGAIVAVLLFAALIWVFWPSLVVMADRWGSDPRYTHGYLVPLFSIYLLWSRHAIFDAAASRSSWLGLPFLLLGFLLRAAGTYLYFEWIAAIALLPCLAGFALVTGGRPALRWSWPAIAFLVFMVPLPFRVEVALALPLQRIATVASTYALQALGFIAIAEGNTIRMGDVRLGVVEACGGLSMLLIFFALSTAVAIIIRRPWYKKVPIFLSAIPIALVANISRITVTGVLHKTAGHELADRVFHDLAGWLMMPLALALLWLELKLFDWLVKDSPKRKQQHSDTQRAAKHRRLRLPMRINAKATFALTAVAVAFALTIYFAHAAQVRRSIHGLYEEAKRLERDGDANLAADCFAQYLALVPEDIDAKARFALLIGKAAKTPNESVTAYLALWDALRADSKRDDIRWQLARLAMRFGSYPEVHEHMEVLLPHEPRNAQFLLLRARLAVREKKDNDAGSWYAKAAEVTPKDIEICAEYATLAQQRLKSPNMAEQIIERMLRATGRTSQAQIAAGQCFLSFDLPDKAETSLADGVQNADKLWLRARAAQAQNRGKLVEERLKEGLSHFPTDSRFPRELARLASNAGRREEAQEYLKSALAKWPDQPEELWQFGLVLVDLDRKDEAVETIRLLENRKCRSAAAQLRAKLLMKQEVWPEAAKLLEKTRKDSWSVAEFARYTTLMLVECYGKMLNPDQQLVVLQQATSLDPSWKDGRRRLAQVLAETGNFDDAIATLEISRQGTELSPEDKATLAQLYLQRAVRMPSTSRDWSKIEALLRELSSWNPSTVMSIRAQALAAQGRFDEARRQAESWRELDRNQVAPWLFLCGLAERQESAMFGDAILAEAERELGPRVEFLRVRAVRWLKASAATREKMPDPLRGLDQFTGKDRNRALDALGEAFSAFNERETARRLWAELATRDPNNLMAWCDQLDDNLEKKKWDQAQRALDQIRRLNGAEGAHTLYAEATLRLAQAGQSDPADRQKLAEARDCLARAAASRPSWGRIYVLDALIYEREGNLGQALEKYNAALHRGETQLSVKRRAVELMYAQRLFGDAAEFLRTLPDQALASSDLVRLASFVTLENVDQLGGQPQAGRRAALEQARKAVAADPTNDRNQAWLGQIAALAGEPKEAEQALRRACALKPQPPETWGALVGVLAPVDAKRAEAAIEEAKKLLTAEQLPLALALCHESMGRIQQAAEQYQTALTASPNDIVLLRNAATFYLRIDQPAKAIVPLRKLIETVSANADVIGAAWGRRQLALALAFQGGYQQFNEAQSLLEQNRQHAGNNLEDQKARALVMATRFTHRRQAIQLFESLGPPNSSERYLLAQLHEANGNWPAAEQQFRTLLQNKAKNPAVLARYVRGLISQRQTNDAASWLRQLVALAPDSLDTLDLQVAVLKQSKRNDDAADLVLKYAQSKDARLDLAARWLESLDRPADAERLFRAFADSSIVPGHKLELALFMGRQKRVKEGLAICEKSWESCDPLAVAVTCLTILRAGGVELGDQDQQVDQWMKAALAKHPERIELRHMLAELQELRGRYDDAIAMDRQNLEKDPSDVVALNNLAVLLALKTADLNEAFALVQRAIAVTGPVPELLDTRATIYLRQGRVEQARWDLEDAVRTIGASSPAPAIYVRLARAQLAANDRAAAQASYRKALDAGFRIEMLHPLEREKYRELAKTLE